MIITYIISIALIVSAILDIIYRRVPNLLTISVILFSIINTTFSHGIYGLFYASIGLILSFILGFILNRVYLVGGGDIKLMMIIASLGNLALLYEFLKYSAYACGFVALTYLLLKRQLLPTIIALYILLTSGTIQPLKNISKTSMPMAVPLCLGGLWVLWG